MNLALCIALFALATTPSEPASEPAAAAIVTAAKDAERDSGAVIGVSILQIESGRHVSFRGGETFQMASVFKLPVAIAVLGAVEKGALSLDQEVEIRKKDRREVGPINDEWKPGMRVTVARMIDVMLVDSDNTAADKLCALLGGPHKVEIALAARGVTGVRISLDERGMGLLMKKDLAALERGKENGTSPDAFAGLLAGLFRGEILPRPRTDLILDAMRRCATGKKRLRAGLPPGTEVRDKTGTLRSCANDAGIVTLPDGTHLIVAAFTRGGTEAALREGAIASVARAAWRVFAPSGASSGGTPGRASLRAWSNR